VTIAVSVSARSGKFVKIAEKLVLGNVLAPDLIRICAAAPKTVQKETSTIDCRRLKRKDSRVGADPFEAALNRPPDDSIMITDPR
jgi:hypothetical protein